MDLQKYLPKKTFIVLSAITAVVAASAFRIKEDKGNIFTGKGGPGKNEMATSLKAYDDVYKVLVSPRCMNCHPSGDIPLQGDDSHLHTMNPKRGKDGHGLYAMKCTNCHQPANTPGLNTPPGNPKWALPPAEMKMVFQGKGPRELALQIMDPNQNGHKTKAMLIEHARDTLVKAGWNMGDGRKPPPLPYDEFVAAWDTWINTGGFAPAK